MEIKETKTNGVAVLSLSGRLDTNTAPQLHDVLERAIKFTDGAELDFAEVSYISSAGLRTLLLGEKQAKGLCKTMTLKNVSPEVMEVFEMTGFKDILTIV